MISVQEAKNKIIQNIDFCPIQDIFLEQGLDKILAEDIFSPIDVPSFDNSAMDGYALFLDKNRQNWQISHLLAAGQVPDFVVKTGHTCRIFTGAMIPQGVDTVIPQEFVEKQYDTISLTAHHFGKGANIRKKGSQCQKGQLLIPKNTLLNAGSLALLASVGIEKVPIFAPPSVAILLTGDELQSRGKTLELGKIYDSNSVFLQMALQKIGISNTEVYHSADQMELLEKTIQECLQKHDVLILTGGISVGDYDLVKNALKNTQVEELFYKIKQKPGKPLWVGKKDKKWVFALPGNPASVATCFAIYLKPCLLAQMGHQNTFLPVACVPLATDYEKKIGLTHFLKAKIDKQEALILDGQESFNLAFYPQTTHLIVIKEDDAKIEKGTFVELFEA